ncbi:MAG: DUF1080 domain-containing protein, partial [Acidobacteria bacterium]|nr:DUF1080 domain-containing protein [Acidobacteriota bacterium]
MSRRNLFLAAAVLAVLAGSFAGTAQGWQKLFDGKTMNGWRLMAVHGGNGGVWTVENGALVANQEKDHKGG